jgi:hypothetical protein
MQLTIGKVNTNAHPHPTPTANKICLQQSGAGSTWVTWGRGQLWMSWWHAAFKSTRPAALNRLVTDLAFYGNTLLVITKPIAAAPSTYTSSVELWSNDDVLVPSSLAGRAVSSMCSVGYAVAVVTAGDNNVTAFSRLSPEIKNYVAALTPPASVHGKVLSVSCARDNVGEPSYPEYVVAVAQLTTGGVAAWGSSSMGQTNVPASVAKDPASTVQAVSAGATFALYLMGGNVIMAGALPGGMSPNPLPKDVTAAGTSVIDVAAGQACALCLTSAGRVLAWGFVTEGCKYGMPLELQAGTVKVSNIAVGSSHSMALLAGSGKVMSWGVAPPAGAPAEVLAGGVSAIAAAQGYSLAMKSGAVYAWGMMPCGSKVPSAAKVQNAVGWMAAADTHAVIRLRNGAYARDWCTQPDKQRLALHDDLLG